MAKKKPQPEPNCQYCLRPARKAKGREVYPHAPKLFELNFWVCNPCGARVGCHGDTWRPMGRLANADLRQAKKRTHFYFDKIWQNNHMTRKEAYQWLAESMNFKGKIHIGYMSMDECRDAANLSIIYLREKGELP